MTLADKLRPYVASIQQAAKGGDNLANEVISLYQLHVAAPQDPAAPALCEAAFDVWLKRQNLGVEK